MLTYQDIEDLLCMRMSEPDIRKLLLELTPKRIDSNTLGRFVQTLQRISSDSLKQLPPIEAATIDCCGTGGSGLPHFNTSTTVAFVLASSGVKVAKFGNRGAISASGSFDLLNELGITPELKGASVPYLLDECGLVFLSAPRYYPVLSNFRAIRKSLGVKTIFNFIGPLLNPVNPTFRLLGVCDPIMQTVTAEYLACTPHLRRALVVRGERGLDDIDCQGRSLLIEVDNQRTQMQWFSASTTASVSSSPLTLTPRQNLSIFRQIVEGRDTQSNCYHLVTLNAAAGLYTSGAVCSIAEGISHCKELLAASAVLEQIEKCRRVYAKYAA